MHIHILGICGTFMGSLAILAKELGYRVSGCDQNVYPPMSTQLEDAGIELIQGYDVSQIALQPDIFVIGNAMSRGNPLVEEILERGLRYTSGPQFLHEHVLPERWVIAVSGTHGKTTTATMVASILEFAEMSPGFLIGGVPLGFERSARLGESPFFVVEADEYDSAFFDKRSKFVHYQPRTLIINNLEFDHADIFADLAAIQRQFHHVIRLVPRSGQVIYPAKSKAIAEVIDQGCWSEQAQLESNDGWASKLINADGSHFSVFLHDEKVGEVQWDSTGNHSVSNGLAAIAAARHVGVAPAIACEALSQFAGVKRRMECLWNTPDLKVYDDFAHHPTAIETTLNGLREKVGEERILAVIEPRSNTMKSGVHNPLLGSSATAADAVLWFDEDGQAGLASVIQSNGQTVVTEFPVLKAKILAEIANYQHIVVMSNGGFGGLHKAIIAHLKE
ncbi:UDP-N-acetylmuramate:L-alanyl-gamma-D-glutamyl-meso-diaminopimelate ligase [uncultured Umboniibacter sp.]|uniref:UDP-N-acetylmuramate:L-alanyl-gamma-D-glutamyl- meso-diaminopimelate ligase n=1 Tax=uncultured Umboniibacter sp. TaxID=1798917 RepID=UPI00260D43C7|nr:UDP-N-acetylmuramate:L-alanyl-gamma-D-glutamyl-meso-diaminopimelate ligase [uncultured Umboniibacter sp.]